MLFIDGETLCSAKRPPFYTFNIFIHFVIIKNGLQTEELQQWKRVLPFVTILLPSYCRHFTVCGMASYLDNKFRIYCHLFTLVGLLFYDEGSL